MVAEIKELNEECGIFGIWGHPDAAKLTYYGLHSLQHRGQEGAGIVVSDGDKLTCLKDEGLVSEVFNEDKLATLVGKAAIGHVRYSSDDGGFENVQPLLFHSHNGSLGIAQNGSLVNINQLKHELELQGSIFQTTSDTEIIAHLSKKNGELSLLDRLIITLNKISGAYALLMMTETALIVAVDPHGFHPLALGKLGDAYVVASETCAFDLIGATYIRDIEGGELLTISDQGIISDRFAPKETQAFCSMELIYFLRPDSNVDGINVHAARKNMGKILAKESPIKADVVTAVPDSGVSAAIGYAEQSGIPYELGLIKNRYVGRTFIQPSQALRERGVKMKLSPVRGIVEGKRVVLIDDSIVRGTTSRQIIQMLRDAGAAEVHIRSASPPLIYPCYYGVDTTTSDELIAANKSVEEIRQEIGADTLAFLSESGLVEACDRKHTDQFRGQCMACFNGTYPVKPEDY